MVNMSAKFDKEICNGLVSIAFTRSSHRRTDGWNHARTDGRNHSSVSISPPQRGGDIIKKDKLFSNSFSTCKMSLKVSQNFAVFVPEKCHFAPENPRIVPEKYGMYVSRHVCTIAELLFLYFLHNHTLIFKSIKSRIHQLVPKSPGPKFTCFLRPKVKLADGMQTVENKSSSKAVMFWNLSIHVF